MMGGNNNAKTIEKNNCSMFNWIRIRNIACIITSIIWLAIFNWSYCCSSWTDVALLLMSDIIRREMHMTIVVKKVPKFLRGIVKFIFRIKD